MASDDTPNRAGCIEDFTSISSTGLDPAPVQCGLYRRFTVTVELVRTEQLIATCNTEAPKYLVVGSLLSCRCYRRDSYLV